MMIAMPLLGDMPMLKSSATARSLGAGDGTAVALFEAEFDGALEDASFLMLPEVQGEVPATTQTEGRLPAIEMFEIATLSTKSMRAAGAELVEIDSPVLTPSAQNSVPFLEAVTKSKSNDLTSAQNIDGTSEARRRQPVNAANVAAGTKNLLDSSPNEAPVDQRRDRLSAPRTVAEAPRNEGLRLEEKEKVTRPSQSSDGSLKSGVESVQTMVSEQKVGSDTRIVPLEQGRSDPRVSRNVSTYQVVDAAVQGSGPARAPDIDETRPAVVSTDKPRLEVPTSLSTKAQSNSQKQSFPGRDFTPQDNVAQDGSAKDRVVQTALQKPDSGVLVHIPARNADRVSVARLESPGVGDEASPNSDRRETSRSSTTEFNHRPSIPVGQTQDALMALRPDVEVRETKIPVVEPASHTHNRSFGERLVPMPPVVSVAPMAIVNEPAKVETEPLTFKMDTDGELRATSTGKVSEIATMRSEPPRPAVHQLAEAVRNVSSGTIEVKLAPEELGRVKLSLTPSDAGLAVTVLADRPETLDLIRRNIEVFAQDLRQQGHQNLSFQFGQHDRNRQSGNDLSDQFEKAETSLTEQTPYAQRVIPALAITNGRLDLRI